ncbi:SusD/RagB family nutrient-binding outer membrane lipoprotein [Chryseolinea lacunae]|uniref:SusD/RagB family nutrient-binding outer membrane lipoprotein n=1 Tax=Chryseolinea lacunae TaxID=2801331 RepID=A0ABS1L0G7_9BACT|nr:SusD/RagB family nutrient-binding outer membrane lipoprotein [Chryseolinea lacunae]MBL0745200.1 SusD/RagB family nutrient-binding outer membrane lipoprotein [Chryseolinea lacunae]
MKINIKRIQKSVLALSVVSLLSVTGCSDYLDVNTDPNNPLDSKLQQILPTVEAVIFESLGNGSGGLSDLTSQFVHHTVQRGTSNFYFVAGNEFSISNAWPNMYAGALMDINQMIRKGTETQSYHYLGVAQILKAYTYSMLVDVFGKAAYTEFGQAAANPFPKYDEGADVYPELFKLLDEAKTNLSKTVATAQKLGTDDLVYGTSSNAADKWIRFANSLKLKLYNNVRLTSMYDATAVEAILAEDKMINSVAGGFKLLYTSSNNPENRNPLFKQDYVDANANQIDPYFYLIMSNQSSSLTGAPLNPVLDGIVDPRVPYYFYNQLAGDPPQNAKYVASAKYGDFLSLWFASFNIDPNEGFDQAQSYTRVGLYPCGGAYDDGSGTTAGVAAGQNAGLGGAGYTRLYSYFHQLYTRAELSLTKSASGDARDLFEEAMYASFDEVNELAPIDIAAGTIKTYVDAVLAKYDAADDNGKLELILTEKWIATFGFSVDAYTDYRRTGYPIMFDPATDNNPLTILNRAYPLSFPYFTDDLQINPNAPAQRNPATDKVFWDN